MITVRDSKPQIHSVMENILYKLISEEHYRLEGLWANVGPWALQTGFASPFEMHHWNTLKCSSPNVSIVLPIGGTTEPNNQCTDILHSYDPRTDSWQVVSTNTNALLLPIWIDGLEIKTAVTPVH